MNVTVSWTLSGGDSANFYLISITTNAPQTPYGGLLNITTASVTQYELTGFMADYEYNITMCGANCARGEAGEDELLTITPQRMYQSNFREIAVTFYNTVCKKLPHVHKYCSMVVFSNKARPQHMQRLQQF